MGVDAVTWRVIGLVLTLLGLVLTVLVWRRRGAAAGIRALAWSLLPLAAGLTGTLRLLADIADAVGRWAVRLVFSPVVWLGVIVAAVSVVLFAVSALLGRVRSTPASRTSSSARAPSAISGTRTGSGTGDGTGDDAELEAILRRHGIS